MAEIQYDVNPEGDNYIIMLSAESWCVPCRQFAPTFKRAAAEYEGDLRFYKVDVDENPAIADRFSVRSVPTVIHVKDGVATSVDERRPVPFLNYVEQL